MRIPRFTDWLLIAVGLLLAIAVIQPQQLLTAFSTVVQIIGLQVESS